MEGSDALQEEVDLSAPALPPPPPLPHGSFQPAIAPGFNAGAGDEAAGVVEAGGGRNGQGSAGESGNLETLSAYKLPPRDLQLALRPGFARSGRKVPLFANHFGVQLLSQEDFFHYNVTIEPPVTNKKISRQVMSKLRATFGQVEFKGKCGAYDGEKSLFTSGSLNFNSKDFRVYLEDERGPSHKPGDKGRPGDSPPPDSPPEGDRNDTGGKRRRTAWGGRDFVVTIEFAARVSMKPITALLDTKPGPHAPKAEAALRVLDIVLREVASSRNYLLVRENFFHPDLGQVARLGEGVEGWRGFHSSIRPTNNGLSLNLDITMTTVLEPCLVVEFLTKHFNVRSIEDLQHRDWKKAKSVLKNVRIETTHMQTARTHKITGFSEEPLGQLSFRKRVKDSDGAVVREEEVSVQEHYHKVYALRLQYPQLPALDVGNKKKPTYIPLELCRILPGQRYTKTLSRGQRQKQIDACKQTPHDRKAICERELMKSVGMLRLEPVATTCVVVEGSEFRVNERCSLIYTAQVLLVKAMEVNKYDSDPLIKEFGMKFTPELASVYGRVLDPPQLEFGGNRTEAPRDGRWNFNGKMMHTGCTIKKWLVAVFDERCHDADNVAQQLAQCCNKSGMDIGRPLAIEKESQHLSRSPPKLRVDTMIKALGKHQKEQPEFILVILPNSPDRDDIYAHCKKKLETVIGIVSQCMVKPRNLNIQYLANLALKINVKMGGYNSPLSTKISSLLGESTIIFGMDVSHGSPGDADSPSVAAVVATKTWPRVSGMYASRVRTQAPKLEMIEGLCDENGNGMVKDLLMEFYLNTKGQHENVRKPQQVIIYRDGVSEGQFKQCLDLELNAFKTAFEKLPGDYQPRITFIVAQKRHGTRFFPGGQGQGECLRNGNVMPGTVVDKDVCHPFNYDFFLCSHAGLIGTTRPTHYHVLYNESKFSPDDLQQLTNQLCYSFARCTTAIAMAAPAAYAHLVATRFRKFVDVDTGSDTSSRGSLGSSRAGTRPVKPLEGVKGSLLKSHSMFFC